MSTTLLKKTRKINKLLQDSNEKIMSFNALSKALSEVLNSNIYILNSSGKVLGSYFSHAIDSSVVIDKKSGDKILPAEYIKNVNKIPETKANLTKDELLSVFEGEMESYNKYATVVPIIGSRERLGTLILARYDNAFDDDDLVLSEYSATVVGLEILRIKSEEMENEMRKKTVVQMAIGTLSFSEREAVIHIFSELGGSEGLLVASKVADKAGITRSVIVNALRKLESAGVIESRSLGMKGTYIKVLNDKLIDELRIKISEN